LRRTEDVYCPGVSRPLSPSDYASTSTSPATSSG
jgi:hypothetical protein